MTRMDAAGGLAVTTTVDLTRPLAKLHETQAAPRLAAADPHLWGPEAADEAATRLGWLDTFERSKALLPRLEELRADLAQRGLTKVVLAGMGGSSLAPEVICRTLEAPLTVLDTTDPGQIHAAMGSQLDSAAVVISGKSGSTVETESLRRAWVQAFTDAGLPDVGRRIVVVTDSGSPLDQLGSAMGAHVFTADADVGGRFSALTAFGLVPAALAGVDVAEIIADAEQFASTVDADEPNNPALALGAALATRPTAALAPDGSGIVGLGDWIEQLLAESTGKNGNGVLPVVVESPAAPGARGTDVLSVNLGGSKPPGFASGAQLKAPDVAVNGPLGAQFLCWELAVAYASILLQVNPFDQPNVTESKTNTNQILEDEPPAETPDFVEASAQVYGAAADNLADSLAQLTSAVGQDGYLAVMAYLDREADAELEGLRRLLAEQSGRPTTFGWGPRFLHSTGQFHKGGRQTGVFLQITADFESDLEVPGRAYTFGQLQQAQAAGDRQALRARGMPLLRVHLSQRAAGVAQLLAAARKAAQR